MLSPRGARGVQKKAELNGNGDSDNNHGGSSGHMYYIAGCVQEDDSYCVRCERAGTGGKGTTRWELDGWMGTLPQPWTVAMEATIFTAGSRPSAPHASEVRWPIR